MKIVLALDDSKYSEAAAEAVIARSWPEKSSFRLISVIEETNPSRTEHSAKIEDMLQKMELRFQQKFPSADVQHEIFYGHCKQQILDFAAAWPADLVALGSHGRTGLTRILLGSVSQTILLYTDCSVLIARVPEGERQTAQSKNAPQRVLIPLDSTLHSRRALDWVSSMDWGDTCQFKILTVLPPQAGTYSDGFDLLQGDPVSLDRVKAREAATTLQKEAPARLIEKIGANRVKTELLEGDAGDTILQVANSWPADLIVMGTRGHGQLKRLWLGSVSQEIVLQARCPVEVVKKRPPDA